MPSFAACRSVLRSAGGAAWGSRPAGGAARSRRSFCVRTRQAENCLPRPTPTPTPTPFGSIRRSAMERCRCVGSLLPYHSATASSLLTSMVSISNPTSSVSTLDDN